MLQLSNVTKEYPCGQGRFSALNHVSLTFRKSEFVAILGPSGAGKTTLLNLIGGLDHCDSGEIRIDGHSTAEYSARDWDFYRNHRIGFVFQSYNLIPHQTVLANVELALTIAGIGRNERRQRARAVLEQVGLQDQMHKHPNELSGGQMQRVAIARALVNDPDILLADEPTGSLDSECSHQIISCLQQVAKERLVVMVTHNAQLVQQYATRIIRLQDGKVLSDSDPYTQDTEETLPQPTTGRVNMRFLTALQLSFHNLHSKKGRTFFAMLAGAIGIIGISLILALSTGLNDYILGFQERTLNAYPITISTDAFDISGIFSIRRELVGDSQKRKPEQQNGIYSDNSGLEAQQVLSSTVSENDLAAFKQYLDDPDSPIHQYVGKNGIVYSYDLNFQVYAYDPAGDLISTDASTGGANAMDSFVDMIGSAGKLVETVSSILGGGTTSSDAQNFSQLLPGENGASVSDALQSSYEVLHGTWPKDYNEVVLVLDRNNAVPVGVLYQLGLITRQQYTQIEKDLEKGLQVNALQLDYEAVCDQVFYLIPACDLYTPTDDGTFRFAGNDMTQISAQLENALQLKITGIVRPRESAGSANITTAIGYTEKLTQHLQKYAQESAVVKAQTENPDVNVLTGIRFSKFGQSGKAEDAKTYISKLSVSEKAAIYTLVMAYRGEMGAPEPEKADLTPEEKAAEVDAWLENTAGKALLLLFYNRFIDGADYQKNMRAFGNFSYHQPSAIRIYTDSFADKEAVDRCVEDYNARVSKDRQILYTDYVELMTASFRSVIDVITYVLIGFVAVSLVVCCIMIGIITHISVLERRREIGILRSLGASRGDVRHVFNAENILIGFGSGVAGVCIAALLTEPVNHILWLALGTASLRTRLPLCAAVLLVLISVVITVIGGLIPALRAAKDDPVRSLRSE